MIIPDSIDTLRAALDEHRGTARERRVRLLLELAQRPDRGVNETLRALEIAKQTGYAWLRVYRSQGLNSLLRLQARSRQESEPEPSSPPPVVIEDNRLIAMLNRLPTQADTVAWIKELRSALLECLDDVDHIVINVVTTLDLLRPETNRVGQIYYQEHNSSTARTRVRVARQSDSVGWESLYEQGRRNGFPVKEYWRPRGFDYHFRTDDSYLGSILLFRKRDSPDVSAQTVALMESLRPFFVFLLSDCVARQRLQSPADLLFRDLVPAIDADARLTEREREVLMLMVTGYTHPEIANHLHIARSTVRKHANHIYEKLGVQRLSEIYARYLTPRLYIR